MKKYFLLLGGLAFIMSCAPSLVDYATVSVPEEGSLSLVQYTKEEERVVGPNVIRNKETGVLNWYAPAMLAVSPDDTKVAYLGKSNDFNNMYLKNIKGGRSTIQRTHNRDILDMSYSPDGKYIAFSERKTDGTLMNIYSINATEGVAVRQLVATSASELSPSYSKDGGQIYFVKSEGSRYYIWSLDVESSLETQYTEGFTPSLNPNGEDLIITRNSRDGARGEIWTINLKKGTETLILNDPKKGFSSPQISPDGKKVICVGTSLKDKTKPQNLDLYTVNIDGTNLTQLTFHGGNDVSPVWSTDGSSIFFISQRGNKKGEFNVWKMEFKN